MLYPTKGIVFKLTRFKETSAIVSIYTKAFGLKTYIENGVFSSRGKNKAAYFQNLNLLDLVVYNKPNSNINRIKEIKPAYLFKDLPFNILKITVVQFVNEVLVKSIKEEEANEKLFTFLQQEICAIDDAATLSPNYLIFFLLKLSNYLGFGPLMNYAASNTFFDLEQGVFVPFSTKSSQLLDENESELLSKFLILDEFAIGKLSLKRETRQAFLDSILKYYKLHVAAFDNLKSLEVIKQLFD